MTKLGFETLGGSGPAVVLLHGLGADRLSWTGIVPALTDRFSLQAVELPGHGRAAAVEPGESLASLLERFDTLLDTLGEPVHLIGHSLGGGIALLLAERRSAQVASLSLLAPAGLGRGVDPEFLSTLPALTDAAQATTLLQAMVVNPRLIPPAIGELLLQHLDTDGVRARIAGMASRVADVENAVESLVSRWQQAPRPRVLLLWGEDDRINPPPTEEPVPDASVRFERLSACGHLPHIEQRVEVTRLLREFLVQ